MNNKKLNIVIVLLSLFVTIGFFIVLKGLFFKEIPEINSDMLWMLTGCLATNFTQIISYFFGSSAGSNIKSELISERKKSDI